MHGQPYCILSTRSAVLGIQVFGNKVGLAVSYFPKNETQPIKIMDCQSLFHGNKENYMQSIKPFRQMSALERIDMRERMKLERAYQDAEFTSNIAQIVQEAEILAIITNWPVRADGEKLHRLPKECGRVLHVLDVLNRESYEIFLNLMYCYANLK